MKCSVRYIGSLVICTFIACGLFRSGNAGKTLRLPGYRVKFGTWPLMEVTKTGFSFKSGRGGKSIRGPIRGPNSFKLGPPLPGKLVLVSAGDKGSLHQQLQASLKHYARQPSSPNLPIIVKAHGPHPPPPPPGYRLGPPQNSFDSKPEKLKDGSTWKPGPPPGLSGNPSSNHSPSEGRPSRLYSALKNSAFSNYFGNGYNVYQTPEALEGKPFPGPYISTDFDGSQVATYVNEGVMPNRVSEIERRPVVPPVIRVGDNPPDNYTVIYAERQIVGVKAPDTLENSGNSRPGTTQYDVAVNLGTKYEQGYGPKPADRPPLLIQKFQKRGDHHHQEEVPQELPDTSLIVTTNIVFNSPNISAPLGGRKSEYFKAGLQDKQKVLKQRQKQKPLDVQVKLLGRLFTKLQRLQPPKISVPIDELDHYKPSYNNDDEEEDAWKKVAKSKVDPPIMAVQIQTFSVPEVNSGDPDIVESHSEFGTHDVEFAESDQIVNLMEGVMNHGSSRINVRDLGSNPDEINDNLSNWVRRHLSLTRDINQEAHAKSEDVANKQFRQYQTFLTPAGGGNGWKPSDPMPLDPKAFTASHASTVTGMVGRFEPPPQNK